MICIKSTKQSLRTENIHPRQAVRSEETCLGGTGSNQYNKEQRRQSDATANGRVCEQIKKEQNLTLRAFFPLPIHELSALNGF